MNNNVTHPVSAAVLAGGASSRMGHDKSLLTIAGETLIERVVARLAMLSDDVMVVTNDRAKYSFLAERVRFVADAVGPGHGPLAGIASALVAAEHERVVVVATDMPFLNVALLHYLTQIAPTADAVVPMIAGEGFPETLHAVYGRGALPAINAQLAAGRGKIADFFSQVQVVYVGREELIPFDAAFRSFVNINTPEEWLIANGDWRTAYGGGSGA